MSDVVMADLEVATRTAQLFVQANRLGWIGGSPADRLRFFTTAQHAQRAGDRPCALFASLARRRCWVYGSLSDEDTARNRLRELDSSPVRACHATIPLTKPKRDAPGLQASPALAAAPSTPQHIAQVIGDVLHRLAQVTPRPEFSPDA